VTDDDVSDLCSCSKITIGTMFQSNLGMGSDDDDGNGTLKAKAKR